MASERIRRSHDATTGICSDHVWLRDDDHATHITLPLDPTQYSKTGIAEMLHVWFNRPDGESFGDGMRLALAAYVNYVAGGAR